MTSKWRYSPALVDPAHLRHFSLLRSEVWGQGEVEGRVRGSGGERVARGKPEKGPRSALLFLGMCSLRALAVLAPNRTLNAPVRGLC